MFGLKEIILILIGAIIGPYLVVLIIYVYDLIEQWVMTDHYKL